MHHKDAVNQNLRAGRKVRITDNAKNKNIHWEIGEFVKYTHVYVCIDRDCHFISINSVEAGAKDPQRLKRGDEISIADTGKVAIKGRMGKFDRYADVRVDIDGSYHRVVVNSVEAL